LAADATQLPIRLGRAGAAVELAARKQLRLGCRAMIVTWPLLPLRCNVWRAHSLGLRSMTFVVVSIIYAGTVLLCVGTAAWIVRAWTRRRYWHKSPSDLHYIAVGIILLVSAGIGIVVASQIVVVLGYAG
jgi:hypothetical protein